MDTIKYHTGHRTPHEKVTKTQENNKYKRGKRSALSQQVTSRLQETVHVLSLVTDNNPNLELGGGEWPKKLFHDQSPRKYGTGLGSSTQPLDLKSDTHLQSDTLLTGL